MRNRSGDRSRRALPVSKAPSDLSRPTLREIDTTPESLSEAGRPVRGVVLVPAMRRGLLALGCVAFGAAATTFAACGGNAVGICDFDECGGGEGGTPDATSIVGDGSSSNVDGNVSGNEAGVGDDGSGDDSPTEVDGSEDSPTNQADSAPSCGPDASTAYCGADAGCVDTTTSADNCLTCGHACPVPTNGNATCIASQCGVACNPSLVLCPETTDCENPNDPAHCGVSCQVCPGPTGGNGSATCPSGSCGLSCNNGYVLCGGTCHADNGPPTDPCVVTEAFGVFVKPGAGSASPTGTKAAPYGTISAGITAAKTHSLGRVFVCAGTDTTAVTLDSSSAALTVFGGFNCSTWAYDTANQHTAVAPPSGIALTMTGVTAKVTIDHVEFDAANASGTDASGNGKSSIAAFASDSSNVTLSFVTLKAGNGVNGNGGGAAGQNYSGGNTAPGGQGPGVGDTGEISGPLNTCTDTTSSKGGFGGQSSASANGVGSGGSGTSTPLAVSSTAGIDGAGGAAGTTAINACTGGHPGANGAAATAVGGATAWGTLTTSGWTPASGANATSGSPGEGGGGGGGSTVPPLSAGSGGAGGCGGAGGIAGSGGGSSFALLAFNSPITLSACTLSTENAGSGGGGSKGEDGQSGGAPGTSAGACGGGFGGNGGGGGGGGGGAAGLSLGVGYIGTSPSLDVATTFDNGGSVSGQSSGGDGGNGGSNALGPGAAGNAGGKGKAGLATKIQLLN